jgi:hypothetical protein
MSLDFSAMMDALAGGGESAPEPAAADPAPGVDPDDFSPERPRRPPLDAAALLADIQEHKRRIEMTAKSKLKKDKKVEKSRGYLDKLSAMDKFRKTQIMKGPGSKHRDSR